MGPRRDVAIVIVSYRTAQLTINSLASLRAERGSADLSLRVYVVDNASGDFAAIDRAVRENAWAAWVTVIAAPRNGGFSYGNNRGIEQACATGIPDYFYLLNPDTEVRPGAIRTLIEFLEAHPNAGIAGSSIELADGTDWPIAFKFPSPLGELVGGLSVGLVSRALRRWEVPQRLPKIAQPVDWICGASMMIRATVFAAIGALDENYFLYFEETDLCLRAQRAGIETWYVPASRIMHIIGQSTQLTELEKLPRRLPAYWFESRRRYFATAFGVRRAILVDIVALVAHAAGWLKRVLTGRRRTAVPRFLRDLLKHSIVWPRNRRIPPIRTVRPYSGSRS